MIERFQRWLRGFLGVPTGADIWQEVRALRDEIRASSEQVRCFNTLTDEERTRLASALHSLADREIAIRFDTEPSKRIDRSVSARIHEVALANAAASHSQIQQLVRQEMDRAVGRRLAALFGVEGRLEITMVKPKGDAS